MAKFVLDADMDALHTQVALSNAMHLCVGQPVDRADTLVRSVGTVAMVPGDGNGDYTFGDGTPDGRQDVITAKNAVPITANGDIDHVALIDATLLHVVTTTPTKTVSNGDSADVSTWAHTVRDPT